MFSDYVQLHLICLIIMSIIFSNYMITIWLFNIAMENPNHKWRF